MKSIIITGCTSGLGRAFHDKVVSKDFSDVHCVFIGRSLERLIQHENHYYYEMNLSSESQIDWDKLYASEKPKSIKLISNAGTIHPLGSIMFDKHRSFRDAIKVNMTSPAELISSLVLWTKVENINVSIINVTSGAALRPIAGWGAYCMSKAGIKMFLDVIALENEHVRVVHFDPGVMDTSMQGTIRKATVEDVPSVNSFQQFAEEGKLKDPNKVAIELADMCGLAL